MLLIGVYERFSGYWGVKWAKGIADTDVDIGADDPKEDKAGIKEVVEGSPDCVAFIHDIL